MLCKKKSKPLLYKLIKTISFSISKYGYYLLITKYGRIQSQALQVNSPVGTRNRARGTHVEL